MIKQRVKNIYGFGGGVGVERVQVSEKRVKN